METIIKGGVLMLFLGNDAKSIPLATNHTLRISGETNDTSNKDVSAGMWTASTLKTLSWEVTTDNLYSSNGVKMLNDLMVAGTPINAFFFQKNEAEGTELPASGSWAPSTTNYGFSGQVIITSLEVTAQNGENATFSATFTGYGRLVYGMYGQTQCDTPYFDDNSLDGEHFVNNMYIRMGCDTPGADIYYTLNGANPTRLSTLYTSLIQLTQTTMVKAFAVADGYTDSAIYTRQFTKIEGE